MSSPALSITGLTRRFGDVVANNDITLTARTRTYPRSHRQRMCRHRWS